MATQPVEAEPEFEGRQPGYLGSAPGHSSLQSPIHHRLVRAHYSDHPNPSPITDEKMEGKQRPLALGPSDRW